MSKIKKRELALVLGGVAALFGALVALDKFGGAIISKKEVTEVCPSEEPCGAKPIEPAP